MWLCFIPDVLDDDRFLSKLTEIEEVIKRRSGLYQKMI